MIDIEGQGMRWRTGFFRLWLVVSVLYVTWIGAMTWQDRQAVTIRNRIVSRVPVMCHDVRGVAGTDYGWIRAEGPGPWDRYRKNNPFDTCWYEMPSYRALWPTEAAGKTDAQVLAATYAGQVNEEPPILGDPWFTLWPNIRFALIPPIALLIAGIVVGWIVSGFRRSDTTTS